MFLRSLCLFLLLSLCSSPLLAQFHLYEDAFPGSSNGTGTFLPANHWLYYRRALSNSVADMYCILPGQDHSVKCTNFNADVNGRCFAAYDSVMFCNNGDSVLSMLHPFEGEAQVLLRKDSLHSIRPVSFTYNDRGDFFFLVIETPYANSLLPFVAAIYKLERNGSQLIRLAASSSYVDFFYDPESILFFANDEFVVFKSLYANVYKKVETVNIQTGEIVNLEDALDFIYGNVSLQKVANKFFIYDGASFYAFNGDPLDLHKIELPYFAVGTSPFGNRLNICGDELLFRGIHNNEAVLLAFNATTENTRVLGKTFPLINQVDAARYGDGIAALISSEYGDFQLCYFPDDGEMRIADQWPSRKNYPDSYLFVSNGYVWYQYERMPHLWAYTRLAPYSTFTIDAEDTADPPVLQQLFPAGDRVWMQMLNTRKGRELYYVQDPPPSLNNPLPLNAVALPNPFLDQVNVRLDGNYHDAYCEMFNAVGQRCISTYFSETSALNFDLSGFHEGVYFLSIRTECNSTTIKLVKE